MALLALIRSLRSVDSLLCDLGVRFASEIRLAVLKPEEETRSSLFTAKWLEIDPYVQWGRNNLVFRLDISHITQVSELLKMVKN